MHRFFMGLARLMAILGGIVLSVLIVMVVISVIGRETNGLLHGDWIQSVAGGLADWLIGIGIGPVNGDYEIVEAGIAFSIFAFLPLTQLTGGHATVDIFTAWMGARAQRILSMVIDIIFAVVLVIIALQLYEGTVDKYHRGQTTFLLQFPIWWAYAASLFGAAIGALVGVYLAFVRIYEAVTGHDIAPEGMGAEH